MDPNDGSDALTGRELQYQREGDLAIEVPPGGSALFAVDLPTGETAELQAAGLVEPEYLDAGAGLWRVPPGGSLFGLTVVGAPGALDNRLGVRSPEL
ncbi:MAG: hypothetical protein SGJ13_14270 [Actinomycetota bacterium]|nr:hypothetical protein [Actinomycetota bacterium]